MTTTLRRTARGLLAVALLGGGLAWGFDLPRLPRDLALKRGADSPGQVTFSHENHVDADKPDCLACHAQRFSILGASSPAPTPAPTHERMEQGQSCGACHGKGAFGFDDCTMCHAE